MLTPKRVLITGATGFVGGTILDSLSKTRPDVTITAIIRHEAAAGEVQRVYPDLKIIIGDLFSQSLLTNAAADSDFVIHAAGDNGPAVCAMIDGLASQPTGKLHSPRLISLTGPRSLLDLSKPITGSLGRDARTWSDVHDAQAILGAPADRIHAGTDQAIVAHAIAKGIGAILVSPGQLWGHGKGPVKRESNSAFYYTAVRSRRRAFVVGDDTATWSWTSIGDLASAVVFLLERSLSEREGFSRLGVNQYGYYFVSTGDLSMRARAEAVSQRLSLGDIQSISVEEVKGIHPMGHIMWGCGERTRADKLVDLGWRPRDDDWKALMEDNGGERAGRAVV